MLVLVDTVPVTEPSKQSKPSYFTNFCVLADSIPDIILEIRYYSTYNFIGHRIPGYEQPTALLTTEAAHALKNVAKELKNQGYRLKIFDAYRPQKAVDYFVNWVNDDNDTLMRRFFYPALTKNQIFLGGYIAHKSGHTRGSTVDLTLFDERTQREVDMGGTFDYFGERSHPDFVGDLTTQQIQNRRTLREAMIRNGFKPVHSEWWHYTLKNEPFPNTYFDFPVNEKFFRE